MNLLSKLLNLLFPLRCLGCDDILGEEKGYLFCDKCLKTCDFFAGRKRCRICSVPIDGESNLCDLCKAHERYFIQNISCARYKGAVKKAIKRYKFGKREDLYRGLGEILADEIFEHNLLAVDFITAVPIHKNRLKKRGFNQSELLAKYVAKELKIPYEKRALVKIKDVPPQSSLKTPAERRKNVQGAFAVADKNIVGGKNILLIDDVYTTGATLSEISRILIRSGAKVVYTATVAMAKHEKKND